MRNYASIYTSQARGRFLGWGGFYLGPSHRVAAAFSARGCPHGTKLCTAHYFSTGIRNLLLSKNFLRTRSRRVTPAARSTGSTSELISSQIIDGKLRYIEDGTGSKAASKTAPALLTVAAAVQEMVSEMSGRRMKYTITIEGKDAAAAAPRPTKTGKPRGRPPKDPAKKAAEAEQKKKEDHKKAISEFDKV